jgi:hypothetical protein
MTNAATTDYGEAHTGTIDLRNVWLSDHKDACYTLPKKFAFGTKRTSRFIRAMSAIGVKRTSKTAPGILATDGMIAR